MLCQLDGSSLQLNGGDVRFWKPQMRWSFTFLWAPFNLCCDNTVRVFWSDLVKKETLGKGLEE